MTMSAIAAAPEDESGNVASQSASSAWVVVSLAIGLLAVGSQAFFGMLGDVSWLITIDLKWLAGQVPYVDFVEINPPASLLLYLPAVFAANALGLRAELAVSAFGFASIGASLGLSALILRRAGLIAAIGPIAYGFVLIALAVLPGEAFCERDHLAAVFAAPFLALCVARAERAAVDFRLAALAGVGLGLMATIKPPYILVAFALAPYLWRRAGLRAWFGSIEYYCAAAIGLAYIAFIPLGFPGYAEVMRTGVDIYLPIRDSLGGLLVESGGMLSLVIALLLLQVARSSARRSWIAVPALAALGAFGAYVVQGKGWLYQAQPTLMFLTISAGFALEGRSRRATVLGAATMAAAACAMLVVPNLAASIGVGAAAAWLHRRLERDQARETWVENLARYCLVAAIGAACGLCVSERPMAPAIEAALTRLGPHPTVVGLTEVKGFGHPMTRRVGARWVQRVPSLFITAGARRLIDEHPGDAALAERMRPYIERDRKMLVEDIVRQRPDALLVGPLKTRLHAALWSDPEIAAAVAEYRLFATQDGPDFAAELWVRKDLAAPR
jgi:hypothetical protein